MKKFALLAIAALSFSVISCKEEAKVETSETSVENIDTITTAETTTVLDTVNNTITDSTVVKETPVQVETTTTTTETTK